MPEKSPSTYPAAGIVAPKIIEYLATYRPLVLNESPCVLAAAPDVDTIEALIDVAFWTSLRREEQYPPRISLAFVAPQQAAPALTFQHPIPLTPAALTRLAPGVERAGIHLGIWPRNGVLEVWGTTRSLPRLCLIVETLAPGHLIIKCRQIEGAAKFINIAVLEGDQVKLLNHSLSPRANRAPILASLLGAGPLTQIASDRSNILVRLSVSMREHKRGGTILIVPRNDDGWRNSIAHPISYAASPAYSELSSLLQEETPPANPSRRDRITRAVDAIAGFTAIDGATILNEDYDVLGFGAKIIRREIIETPEVVYMDEPIENSVRIEVPIGKLGGTRHISAALFAFEQRNAIAMVASQDGPFTIFAWSHVEEAVFAYRIDSLLV